MKEGQQPSFDQLKEANLRKNGMMPDPQKYPFSDRSHRMPNQFGQEAPPPKLTKEQKHLSAAVEERVIFEQ